MISILVHQYFYAVLFFGFTSLVFNKVWKTGSSDKLRIRNLLVSFLLVFGLNYLIKPSIVNSIKSFQQLITLDPDAIEKITFKSNGKEYSFSKYEIIELALLLQESNSSFPHDKGGVTTGYLIIELKNETIFRLSTYKTSNPRFSGFSLIQSGKDNEYVRIGRYLNKNISILVSEISEIQDE